MSTVAKAAESAESQAAAYLAQTFPDIHTPYTFGGWASTACMIADMIRDIRKGKMLYVLECGSGLTTVYAAAALKLMGQGKIYALEHSAEFRDLTIKMLSDNGLSDYAHIMLAPIKTQTIGGRDIAWYASPIKDVILGKADMIIVDGPPQATGKLARYGAISLIKAAKKPIMVYVDDYHTPETQEAVEMWRENGMAFEIEFPTPGLMNYTRLSVSEFV